MAPYRADASILLGSIVDEDFRRLQINTRRQVKDLQRSFAADWRVWKKQMRRERRAYAKSLEHSRKTRKRLLKKQLRFHRVEMEALQSDHKSQIVALQRDAEATRAQHAQLVLDVQRYHYAYVVAEHKLASIARELSPRGLRHLMDGIESPGQLPYDSTLPSNPYVTVQPVTLSSPSQHSDDEDVLMSDDSADWST